MTRLEKYGFKREGISGQRMPSTSRKGWPMLRHKHDGDQNERTYFTQEEIEANTLIEHRVGDNSFLFDQEGQPVHVKKRKYIVLEDAEHPKGYRMILLDAKSTHSVLAGGKEILYGGFVTTQSDGSIENQNMVDVRTNHYELPIADNAISDFEKMQAKAFNKLKNRFFYRFFQNKPSSSSIASKSTVSIE